MSDNPNKGKTGIFYVKDPASVVVMQNGQVMHRYKNVQELVDAHLKGVIALEKQMEDVLAGHYRPDHD